MFTMRSSTLLPLTAAILLASFSAQQSMYSGLADVGEFVSRLDLDPASEGDVYNLVNVSYLAGGVQQQQRSDAAERSLLACRVAEVVFGNSLYTPSSAEYADLVDDNWLDHIPFIPVPGLIRASA